MESVGKTELHFKKKYAQAGNDSLNIPPKILAGKEKATILLIFNPLRNWGPHTSDETRTTLVDYKSGLTLFNLHLHTVYSVSM